MNKVMLIGRLTRDPELKYSGDMGICTFTVAVNRQKKDEADFIMCKAFGKTAENVGNYMKKGRQIAVEGRIQTGSYDNKETGKKVYTTDIICDRVEFLGSAREEQPAQPSPQPQPEQRQIAFSAADDELPF